MAKIISRIVTFSLIFSFFSLTILDIFIIFFPGVGRVGFLFWILSFLLLVIFCFYNFFVLLKKLVNQKQFTTIGVLIFLFSSIIANTVNPANLSHETTQEITCVINNLKLIDLGYSNNCFLGYPEKQFIIPSAFTAFFGRTQFMLNFGFASYLLIGITFFVTGYFRFMKISFFSDILIASLLSMLLHFYYFNSAVFMYEQSIVPISLSLMLTGSFLIWLNHKSINQLMIMGLVLYYSIFSYTPALSLIPLSLFSLVYLLVKERKNRTTMVTLILFILALLIPLMISISTRGDLKIYDSESNFISLAKDLLDGFVHIVLLPKGNYFVSPLLTFIFVITLLVSLVYSANFKFKLLSIWIILTIISSLFFKGYAYYGIDFRLQRAIVVIPLFLLLLSFQVYAFRDMLTRKRTIAVLLFLFLFLTGVYYHNFFLQSKKPDRHLAMNQWLLENLSDTTKNSKMTIYFESSFHDEYISLYDSLQYFLPNFQAKILTSDCIELTDKISARERFLLFSGEEVMRQCPDQVTKNTKKMFDYTFQDDRPLVLYNSGV